VAKSAYYLCHFRPFVPPPPTFVTAASTGRISVKFDTGETLTTRSIKHKQGMQYTRTYKASLRGVPVTTVTVGKAISIKYYVCVCIIALVMRYANRFFSAPYSIRPLWSAWLYNIFPHYLTKGTIKNVIEHKM